MKEQGKVIRLIRPRFFTTVNSKSAPEKIFSFISPFVFIHFPHSPFPKSLVQHIQNAYNKFTMSGIWKKQFGDMNAGIVKITVAERVAQNCIQKNAPSTENPFPDNKLSQILKVKTLGNEVSDVLKPKMQPFEKMTPLDYQAKLSDLIGCLQLLGQSEKRSVVKLIYRDAVRVLQAETVSADLLEEFRIMLLQG